MAVCGTTHTMDSYSCPPNDITNDLDPDPQEFYMDSSSQVFDTDSYSNDLDNQFFCEFCYSKFGSKQGLQYHMRTTHNPDKVAPHK